MGQVGQYVLANEIRSVVCMVTVGGIQMLKLINKVFALRASQSGWARETQADRANNQKKSALGH